MAERSQEQREVTDDDLKAAVKEYTPAGTQETHFNGLTAAAPWIERQSTSSEST